MSAGPITQMFDWTDLKKKSLEELLKDSKIRQGAPKPNAETLTESWGFNLKTWDHHLATLIYVSACGKGTSKLASKELLIRTILRHRKEQCATINTNAIEAVFLETVKLQAEKGTLFARMRPILTHVLTHRCLDKKDLKQEKLCEDLGDPVLPSHPGSVSWTELARVELIMRSDIVDTSNKAPSMWKEAEYENWIQKTFPDPNSEDYKSRKSSDDSFTSRRSETGPTITKASTDSRRSTDQRTGSVDSEDPAAALLRPKDAQARDKNLKKDIKP